MQGRQIRLLAKHKAIQHLRSVLERKQTEQENNPKQISVTLHHSQRSYCFCSSTYSFISLHRTGNVSPLAISTALGNARSAMAM
jgi:FPC/CPF motif-containing protein YcgG